MNVVILELDEELSFFEIRVICKKLFAYITERLGLTGSLLVGVLVMFIYLLYKNFKNLPKEIVYSY